MASLSLSTGMVCFAFGRATWSFKELSMSVLQSLSVYMHVQTFCIAWLVGTQQVQNDVGHWYGHDAQHSQDNAGIHWWHTWWAWLSWILNVCGSDILFCYQSQLFMTSLLPGLTSSFKSHAFPTVSCHWIIGQRVIMWLLYHVIDCQCITGQVWQEGSQSLHTGVWWFWRRCLSFGVH